jgi:hypothetical protein
MLSDSENRCDKAVAGHRPPKFLLCLALLTVHVSVFAQSPRDDKQLLADTRGAYSTLRRQGLSEVRASMWPNWTQVFKNLPAAQKTTAMRLANRLRFSIIADRNGNIQVTHQVVGPKPNKASAEALDNLAKGVELSATSFLMSWAPFMLTWLIPEKLDHFVMQEQQNGYVLSFTESGVDVSVVMNKDLLMTELRTPQGSVKPNLLRTNDGYVLTGYEANNTDPVVGHTELKARIVSQQVTGLLLPKTVFLEGASGQIPFQFELHFANYRLKKTGKELRGGQ